MTVEVRIECSSPRGGTARLTVTGGPDRGKEIRWSEGKLSVGTADSCDFVLSDRAVSRRHCLIQLSADGAWIRDLNSTNGTRVGHYNVRSAFLKPGAQIALGRSQLRFELLSEPSAEEDRDRFGQLIGRSEPMRAMFEQIGRLATSPATLLLQGETGTGKELVAETVHTLSPRRAKPFLVFDCARVTPSLMETELFGHVRGAFTGARSSRPGVFEAAHGGTVFLDEIGELPLALQPKLLRVLDRQQVTRVGASQPRQIDVHVIAATHRDLHRGVIEGTFRADLYYRLSVVTLQIPPLRERGDDIELLATCFLCQLTGDSQAALPADLVDELSSHSWPGNVRELRNAIERWSLLEHGLDTATPPLTHDGHCGALFEPALPARRSFHIAKSDAMSEWERGYVARLIDRHGSVAKAARAARMDHRQLTNILLRYNLGPRGA